MDELRNDEKQDEELERYGVWVKAGPEEVVDAEDDYSFSDLSEEVDTTDEESMAPAGDTLEGTEDTSDLPSLDEFDDISLDDLEFEDEQDQEQSGQPALESEPSTADQLPTLGDSSDELTIGASDSEEDEEDLISLDDFDLDVPDEEPDPFRSLPDEPEPSEQSEQTADSAEDFNLDELEEELPDDFEELDLDASDPLESDEFDSSIPGSDGELDDLSVDDISVEDSSEELPELEVDALDDSEHDFTPEDQGIEIDAIHPSNTISPDEEEFLNDESDLQNESESAIPASMDLQEREAFQRIQTELTDIKKELAELKSALRGAGTSAAQEPTPADEPVTTEDQLESPLDESPLDESPLDESDDTDFSEEETAEDPSQPGPGFFEEEEDETIALTGDELDNILNTAEFTEQAGEAVELEDDFIMEPEPPGQDEDAEESDELDLGDEFELDDEETGDEQSGDEETGDEQSGDEETGDEDTNDEVDSIELEPVQRDSVVFEGDDSAVDELAEMDIDSELADIDSLEDDTEDDSDELEIDIDSLEDVDTSGVLEESAESAAEENAAELDQHALQADTDDLDDLEVDDLDLDDAESEAETEAEDEPEISEEPESPEAQVEESFQVASEGEDKESGDFDQFAAAVEEDIASGDSGVQLDEEFDQESAPEAEPEATNLDGDDDGEIEIDLDDIDGFDDFDADHGEETVPEEQEPEAEKESPTAQSAASISDLPDDLKQEIRSVLSYMDQLLEALPDDKIEEFAHSEHFEVYKRLFEELGLET